MNNFSIQRKISSEVGVICVETGGKSGKNQRIFEAKRRFDLPIVAR